MRDLHGNILKSQKHVHFTLNIFIIYYIFIARNENSLAKGKILIKNTILLTSRTLHRNKIANRSFTELMRACIYKCVVNRLQRSCVQHHK